MIKNKKYIEYMPDAFYFSLYFSFTNASDTYSIMNMVTHNNKKII